MMSGDDWKTIRVPAEDYHDAKAKKEAHGRTWGEQLVAGEDEPADPDAADIADAVTSDLLAQLPPKIADELR